MARKCLVPKLNFVSMVKFVIIWWNVTLIDSKSVSLIDSINDPCLVIRIDSKSVMQVKQLRWKFQGNYTILVDGQVVEVSWDVYNLLFGTSLGNVVFMFKTCLSAEKLLASQSILV